MTRTSFTRESSPLSINSKTQLSTINRDNSANFRKQGILCVKYLRFFSPFFANVAFSKALIPFSKQTYICIYRERERRAFGVEAILSEHSEPSRFVSHESISSETQWFACFSICIAEIAPISLRKSTWIVGWRRERNKNIRFRIHSFRKFLHHDSIYRIFRRKSSNFSFTNEIQSEKNRIPSTRDKNTVLIKKWQAEKVAEGQQDRFKSVKRSRESKAKYQTQY